MVQKSRSWTSLSYHLGYVCSVWYSRQAINVSSQYTCPRPVSVAGDQPSNGQWGRNAGATSFLINTFPISSQNLAPQELIMQLHCCGNCAAKKIRQCVSNSSTIEVDKTCVQELCLPFGTITLSHLHPSHVATLLPSF